MFCNYHKQLLSLKCNSASDLHLILHCRILIWSSFSRSELLSFYEIVNQNLWLLHNETSATKEALAAVYLDKLSVSVMLFDVEWINMLFSAVSIWFPFTVCDIKQYSWHTKMVSIPIFTIFQYKPRRAVFWKCLFSIPYICIYIFFRVYKLFTCELLSFHLCVIDMGCFLLGTVSSEYSCLYVLWIAYWAADSVA